MNLSTIKAVPPFFILQDIELVSRTISIDGICVVYKTDVVTGGLVRFHYFTELACFLQNDQLFIIIEQFKEY